MALSDVDGSESLSSVTIAGVPADATLSAGTDNGDGTYKNPIIHADYSDPDVVRVGDDFWMTSSSFNVAPGLPILQSKDLVHWKIAGHVLPRLDFHPSYDMGQPYTLTDSTSKPARSNSRCVQT